MDEGFIRLSVMSETNTGGAPSQATLQNWTGGYGISFPVLSDPGWTINSRFEVDNYIPSYTLIGRDMTIRIKDGWPSTTDYANALDEEWPEL